jgi:L-lactate utilization protein LutB
MKQKLVAKINNKITILADKNQYIVKITEGSKPTYCFFPTLDACFQEIFDYLCKKNVADGKNKDIQDIAKIIWETKEQILEIMNPFVDVKSKG